MATKKTTTVKTNARSSGGGTTKKKTAAAQKGGSRKQNKKDAQERLQLSVCLFVAGALLVALAFVEGQSLWKWLHSAMFGLFGCSSYVMGFLVLYWAALVALRQTIADNIGRAVALCLAFCGTLVVFTGVAFESATFMEAVHILFENGQEARRTVGAQGKDALKKLIEG